MSRSGGSSSLFTDGRPSWTVAVDASGNVIATFSGRLSSEEGRLAAATLIALLRERPRTVIFDLRKMVSYDSNARKAWVDALSPYRDHVDRLEVRGGSALVRMGAATIAMFLRVPIAFF